MRVRGVRRLDHEMAWVVFSVTNSVLHQVVMAVGIHVSSSEERLWTGCDGDRTIAVSSGERGQWIIFARVQLCARLGMRRCRRY
eukprot:IDg13554t1